MRTRFIVSIIALLFATFGMARAQSGGGGATSSVLELVTNVPVALAPSPPPLIREINFDGGPVRLLIDRLALAGRQAQPPLPPLNVIVADEMRDEDVPKFQLRNVTYADVFEALNLLTAQRSPTRWQLSSSSGGDPVWVLTAPPTPPWIDPLTGIPHNNSGPVQHCEIYQLQRYLAKYNVDDITTAIHTAWDMVALGAGAQLKYHKDTSLLIAVGRPDQLEIISRVLRSLDEGLASTNSVPSVSTSQLHSSNDSEATSQGHVFVNGAVKNPGALVLRPDEHLDILGAIARAGGFGPRADEKIRLMRTGGQNRTIRVEDAKKGSRENVILQPGDILEVPEKLF